MRQSPQAVNKGGAHLQRVGEADGPNVVNIKAHIRVDDYSLRCSLRNGGDQRQCHRSGDAESWHYSPCQAVTNLIITLLSYIYISLIYLSALFMAAIKDLEKALSATTVSRQDRIYRKTLYGDFCRYES